MDYVFSRKLKIIFIILISSKACYSQCNGWTEFIHSNGTIRSPAYGTQQDCTWKVAKTPNMVLVFHLESMHIMNRGRGKSRTQWKACGNSNKLVIDQVKINCDSDVTQNINNKEFCYAFAYRCVKPPAIDDCKVKNVSYRVTVRYVSDGQTPVGETSTSQFGFRMKYETFPCQRDMTTQTTSMINIPTNAINEMYHTPSNSSQNTLILGTSRPPNKTTSRNESETDITGGIAKSSIFGLASGGALVTVVFVGITVWCCARRWKRRNFKPKNTFRSGSELACTSITTGNNQNNEYEPVDTGITSVYEVTSSDNRNEFLSPTENGGYLCPTSVRASSPNVEYVTIPVEGQSVEVQYEAIDGYIVTESPYEITEALD